MNIVVLDAKTVGNVSFERFKHFGKLTVYETTTKEQTIERIRNANIILTNKVLLFEEELKAAQNLKLICILATGMNNVDLEVAHRLGIEVKNAKGYSTASVTQTTFAMLFYLRMGLRHYDEYTKSKAWCQSDIFTDMSRSFSEIKGKTWGIIGLGAIGRSVANVADTFGAKVHYFSTSGVIREEVYPDVDLKTVMQSDVISIHAPLNEKTKNLITKKELDLMKESATILNLGRGGIINEQDLATTLDKQNIYAGLDVMESEPPSDENPLLNIQNKNRLFITPHVAWGSAEAREALLQITYENIENALTKD